MDTMFQFFVRCCACPWITSETLLGTIDYLCCNIVFRLLSVAPLLFATWFPEKINYYVDAETFYSVLLLFALLSFLVFIMPCSWFIYVLTFNASFVIIFSCCRAFFCLLYECVYLHPHVYVHYFYTHTHTMLLIYTCTARVCYARWCLLIRHRARCTSTSLRTQRP